MSKYKNEVSFEEYLIKKYPKLFNNDSKEPFYWSGVQCDEGWFGLIDDLCEQIIDRYELACKEPCHIAQIKEKFGALRFYVDSYDEEVANLISEIEQKSKRICEICGKQGKIETLGWFIKCVCPVHFKKLKSTYKSA